MLQISHATLGFVLGVAALAPGQDDKPAIRLTGVPQRLVLPLPAGENRVLTAEIVDAEPESVWLATSKGAKKRLPMRGPVEGKFQINLADPRVAALARLDRGRQFRVFARVAGAGTLSSIPISFRLSERPARIELFGRKGKTRRALRDRSWVRPAAIETLELVIEGPTAGYEAELHLDGQVHAFGAPDARGVLALAVTKEIRGQWEDAREAEVRSSSYALHAGCFRLRTIPAQLVPPNEDTTRISLVQRNRVVVPATNGWLQLRIGDVTAGQVLTRLSTADGSTVVGWQSMRQGDEAAFTMHGQRYSLVLDKLVNLLIGADHAEFLLERHDEKRTRAREEQRLIRDLLERVRTSGLTFVREGKEYTAYRTENHLEAKLAAHPVRTAEDFIEKIASRSSTTGNAYLVELEPGKRVEAETWFRARLVELRAHRKR